MAVFNMLNEQCSKNGKILQYKTGGTITTSKAEINVLKKLLQQTIWPLRQNSVPLLPGEGMYKNRVKNSSKIFEIPALLSSQQGNPERENSK